MKTSHYSLAFVIALLAGISGPLEAGEDIFATSSPPQAADKEVYEVYAAVTLAELGSSGISVALDILDPVGIADGIVDQVFVLQTRMPVEIPRVSIANARVRYSDDWLVATSMGSEPTTFALALESVVEHPNSSRSLDLGLRIDSVYVYAGFGLARYVVHSRSSKAMPSQTALDGTRVDIFGDSLKDDCFECEGNGRSCSNGWCDISCSGEEVACCIGSCRCCSI